MLLDSAMALHAMQGVALTAATQRAVREGLMSSQEGAARLVALLHHREAELLLVSDNPYSQGSAQPSSVSNGHTNCACIFHASDAPHGAAAHPPAWIPGRAGVLTGPERA